MCPFCAGSLLKDSSPIVPLRALFCQPAFAERADVYPSDTILALRGPWSKSKRDEQSTDSEGSVFPHNALTLLHLWKSGNVSHYLTFFNTSAPSASGGLGGAGLPRNIVRVF